LIFDNLQKCITYVLASNVPEIIPFVMFVTLQIPLGLEIVQILAVDLGASPAPRSSLLFPRAIVVTLWLQARISCPPSAWRELRRLRLCGAW
jgi:sodium/potassium-transporting ATPase subunit alpha